MNWGLSGARGERWWVQNRDAMVQGRGCQGEGSGSGGDSCEWRAGSRDEGPEGGVRREDKHVRLCTRRVSTSPS